VKYFVRNFVSLLFAGHSNPIPSIGPCTEMDRLRTRFCERSRNNVVARGSQYSWCTLSLFIHMQYGNSRWTFHHERFNRRVFTSESCRT
jgi:hypothetical protein